MYGKLSNIVFATSSKRWVISLAALGAMAFGAARADAGFSVIGKSKKSSEATHQEIFEHRFGGTFSQSGESFSNGTVNITRVDDADDQSFTGDVNSACVIAAFARKSQSFGFFDSTGGFQRLLAVSGRDFDVTGTPDSDNSLSALGNGPITFGRGGGDPKFSANASQNPDGQDHLVTYRVTGGNVAPGTTLLFWEDSTGRQADFDFNDLVVEVNATGEPLLIPLPAAAWSGLSGLVGLGVLGGYKRARRWMS